ncbi:MAG: hypothetical protein AB7S78_12500 [Candidatus Omnitrophota bacterium]
MDTLLGFWFAPVHPVRLRMFEKAFVFTFLLYMLERFRYAGEWLTAEGFHLTEATNNWYHITPFPLLSAWQVPVFAVVLFGSIAGVFTGRFRNIFMAVLFFCAVYVQQVDIISAFTINKLYIAGFAVLALAPAARPFTLDSGETVMRQSAWPLRTLQLTMFIQYFTAGTCKVMYGDWLNYRDVLWTHVQGTYRTDIAAWMLRVLPKWTWTVQMYLALAFETFGAFFFLDRRTVWWAMAVGLGFHLLIAATMHQLIYFSLQLLAYYILFMPEETLLRLPVWKDLVLKRIIRHA